MPTLRRQGGHAVSRYLTAVWRAVICVWFHWPHHRTLYPLYHSYQVRCDKCGREFIDHD
jgi:hypothetical protein